MKDLEKFTITLNKLIKIEKKISQKELAKKMAVSPVAVNKWLNGGSIETSKIPQLCLILEISPNELFGYNTSEFSEEDIEILTKLKQHPEYKNAIKKILDI